MYEYYWKDIYNNAQGEWVSHLLCKYYNVSKPDKNNVLNRHYKMNSNLIALNTILNHSHLHLTNDFRCSNKPFLNWSKSIAVLTLIHFTI